MNERMNQWIVSLYYIIKIDQGRLLTGSIFISEQFWQLQQSIYEVQCCEYSEYRSAMLVHVLSLSLSHTHTHTNKQTNKPCYVSGDQKGTESVVGEKGQDIKWRITWSGASKRLLGTFKYTLVKAF